MITAPLSTHATDDERVAWIDETVAAICAEATTKGWTVADVEVSGRSFSRYIVLDRGDDTLRVRVSDHEPGMGGQHAEESLDGTSKYLGMMVGDLVKALA